MGDRCLAWAGIISLSLVVVLTDSYMHTYGLRRLARTEIRTPLQTTYSLLTFIPKFIHHRPFQMASLKVAVITGASSGAYRLHFTLIRKLTFDARFQVSDVIQLSSSPLRVGA
jgi:hypothetical protein